MRKRGVYLMVVVLVVGGVLVALFAGREREPEYGGKRLSEWVESIGTTIAGGQMRRSGITSAEMEAIRRIGTNALPYLVGFMRYEQPRWKATLYRSLNRALPCDLVDKREALAIGAVTAFHILGPDGDGAFPELRRLLKDANAPQTAFRAAALLLESQFFRTNVFLEKTGIE